MELNETAENLLRRRVHFAFGRFAGNIQNVSVTVMDENGPRGGVDKRCRVMVKRRRGNPVIVEGESDEIRQLVDFTLQRAGRTLAREIKRELCRYTS
jgi:hypothetical protein